jgi:hypothetical protein
MRQVLASQALIFRERAEREVQEENKKKMVQESTKAVVTMQRLPNDRGLRCSSRAACCTA